MFTKDSRKTRKAAVNEYSFVFLADLAVDHDPNPAPCAKSDCYSGRGILAPKVVLPGSDIS